MMVSFLCESFDYQLFINKVGKGNCSKILRNFIKSYSGDISNKKESVLIQEFQIIKKEKRERDIKFNKIKAKLDSIPLFDVATSNVLTLALFNDGGNSEKYILPFGIKETSPKLINSSYILFL